MTNTKELLPCPFCGAKAIWKDGIPKNSPVGYVKCSNETCGFYIDTEHKVWKNPSCWNTRAESQQSESLKAENEELKFRIEELEQQNGFECGCVVSRDEENNRLRKALDDIANFDTSLSCFEPGQVIACQIKNIAAAALAQPKEK